ncbi:oligoendopeptidase F [Natronoarchaeum rubrum]|uniref:oligoendopeptidase F n=1 Tax=Natronoarchaeum rubrum TaxID=755311 RepID=UPI0021137620|nr:oligoendopeptidase F [Natronoarchaeum rubrum]
MSSVPERSEIDDEYKWDLESIYANDEDWETAYEETESRIEELASYEGEATRDGETLLELFELYESVMRSVQQISAYARMRRDEDTRDQEYQAMTTRAQSLGAQASSAASFLEPELQALDREEIDEMIESTDGLEVYGHYVDDVMRMKPHTRSAEIEGLLADLSEVTGSPGEIYNILTNADVEFPTVEDPDGEAVEISLANFTTLQKNPNREFRREVYEQFYDEWGQIRNTVATSYRKSATADVKLARARNYDTAREAAMHGPNVPTDVYDTLLETVDDNLDKLHRHAELKREALGVDELRMWDLYMPMTETESPEVPYEEAREHVVEAVGALGEDYQSRVDEGLDSRWVDVYENRGKQSGAYSGGTYDTQPFILMNYQDDVASMFTLAHELGHSLHSQYTSEHQPYVYSDYEIFTAEVASTVNEALLTEHLLETVEDPTFRRHILNEYLERFRSTLYRQTMFAEFEHRAHEIVEEGGALTPDRLDELYRDLKERFYEPAAFDDRIDREWMRIPHFYRAYYVYQYSTGISAAVALANGILSDGDDAADHYLEFLKRGSREYPLELLADAGVDMRSPEPIESALSFYDDRLDEMAELLR